MHRHVRNSTIISNCLTDVIIGIQKGDSAGTNGGGDLEASLNSLKLNNLSSSISSMSVSTAKSARDIFDRLDPGTFGPKGTITHTVEPVNVDT